MGFYRIFYNNKIKEMKKLLKEIIQKLKELGYLVDESMGSFYLQDNEKEENKIELRFEIDDLPFCCGVREIGGLSLSTEINKKNKDFLKAVKLLIQYAFLTTKEEHTENTRSKIKRCSLLLACSNGNNDWSIVEEALSEIPEHFILISTTRNPSSENIIKVYISVYN
jgi:hypothetical protein